MDVVITARSLNLDEGTLNEPITGRSVPAKILTAYDLDSKSAVIIRISADHWPEFLAYMNDPAGYAERAAARAKIVKP